MAYITDIILKRRSIRRYKPQKIEKGIILEVIRAAMYAPSAVNKQPWHFIVIDDRKIMERIMEIHRSSKMLETASHAVLVCGDELLQHDTGYWIADCGAATQNMLLAATSLGLGSCWIGLYPRENRMNAIRELFSLPSHVLPFAIVSLGYPDEEKEIPDRFKPDRIFYNTWANPY